MINQVTPQQLAAVVGVGDHEVNPRTGAVLFTGNAEGGHALFVLDASGGQARQVVAGRGHYGSWSADGEQVVFLRDESGAEADDVMWLDTRTGTLRALTRDGHTYMWPRFAPDGRLALISNREGNFDPFLMDLETGTLTALAPGVRAARDLLWSPEGRWLSVARMDAADEGGAIRFSVEVVDTHTGERLGLGHFGGDFFDVEGSWRAGEDGPRLCFAADHGDFQELLLLSVSGESVWITEGGGDKSEPQWSPDGSRLAFLLGREGERRLLVREGESGDDRDLSVGDGVHRQPRWAPDGRSLTVLYESATQPRDLWRVTLDGHKEQLTNGLPPELDRAALTPAVHVTFASFDGRPVPALCYRPREANGAAVVMVHGGPTSSHRNGWHPDVQLLCGRGYTVLAPNVRGSTGYGRAFRDLNRLDWGGGDLQDLAAAHSWLHAEGYHRVGIMGGSYGGYLTLMALTQQPTLWQAGAALFPIANLLTLFESSRPGDLRPYLLDQIGDPVARRDFYLARSPVNFVERVAAPLLLLQGEMDVRTPLTEAQAMAERLASAGKAHFLHVYANEGHGFQRRETQADALGRVLAFFNEHLV